MRRWTWGLGGLLIWLVHFSGLYAIASVEAQTVAEDAAPWRLLALAFSAACAAAAASLLWLSVGRLRHGRDPVARLMDQLAALGSGVGLVAIVWQSASATI